MPTITIKNGERTLKLTKREADILHRAKQILDAIHQDFPAAEDEAEGASELLATIIDRYTQPRAILLESGL